MTNYITYNEKPLFPVGNSYELQYNEDGNVLLEDGTVCSDNYSTNSTVVDIKISFPNDFEEGLYFFRENEFIRNPEYRKTADK